VKGLILDFGGVISRTLFETQAANERALGLPAASLTWRGPFATTAQPDQLWTRMQAGEISERDYWLTRSQETGALLGEAWADMQTLVRRVRGQPESWREFIRPEAIECITQLTSQGIKLAICSNELDLFYGADFRSQLPILAQFAVIGDASHTGILKPDPRAYLSICEALQLAPSDCVFVDDQAKNIQGGLAVGLHSEWFDVLSPKASFERVAAHFQLN
jgi:putative hydrolase of the HAD superfamily